jgi:hypothetical protein
MIGYPCFYGNEDLDQDETFIIFSLDPITENSELNLTQAASLPVLVDTVKLGLGDEFTYQFCDPQAVSLPVLVDTVKLGLGDEFTYQFCDQISQICGTFRVIPETQTLILDYNGFCKLASESDMIIDTISSNLVITKESAMQQTQNFFSDKNVIVQAGGAQGTLYKVGSYLQSAGSAGLVVSTLGLAKLAGVSGLQILKAQPMLAVAIPTTGAIFFYGCGAIVGNNTFGKALVTTGNVLAFPMKGVEIMWNSYGNPVIRKVFGIPLILNMTQAFKTGPGYTIEEIVRYIPLNNKSVLKAIKEKIICWLS